VTRRAARIAAGHGARVVVAWALGVLAPAQLAGQGADSSTRELPAYASDALRVLITRASARAATPTAYVARLEQESATFRIRDDGRVIPQTIQQSQSRLGWSASSGAEESRTGYRGETYELDTSLEQGLRPGWFPPVITDDRFRLRQPMARTLSPLEQLIRRTVGLVSAEAETLAVVHPLASDRERAYRFAGGDTLALTLDDGSAFTAIRVRVQPRLRPITGVLVFRGDVWLDARTLQVRRMIGRVDRVRAEAARAKAFIAGDVQPVAYLDVQTREAEGAVVPALVRVEQTARALVQEARSVVRVVSRANFDTVTAGGTRVRTPTRRNAADSVTGYRLDDAGPDVPMRPWRLGLGEATQASLGADERFVPWWPERELPTGPAIGRLEVRRDTDLYRFNRIEGLFTGAGLTVRFRDRLPGAVLRSVGGWAWNERTWRARASFNRTIRGTTALVGVGKFLDLTNDFRSPYDSGSTWLPLLLSTDPYDYVERRYARLGFESAVPDADAVVRLEAGLVRDVQVQRSVTRGLVGSSFLPNRGVDEGTYGRVIGLLELGRNADLDPTGRSVGATLRAEVTEGTLEYQRLEARVVGRARFTGGALAAVAHAGTVLGSPPPQQLFELGGLQYLPGYAYKEFAGDRAASATLIAALPIGLLRDPIGEIAGFVVPAIAPSLQLGLSAGWTDLVSPTARRAAERLGPVFDPVTGTALRDPITGGIRTPRGTRVVRSTLSVGLQLFGGALYVGAGRAVDGAGDAPRNWRAVVAIGRLL
jgi:hypothetical protein